MVRLPLRIRAGSRRRAGRLHLTHIVATLEVGCLVVAHERVLLPRVLGSDDGPPLGSAVALRGAEVFFITPSLLAPRLKLQPEPNNLGTPQIKSITIDIRKQNIPMQTMETQRRGAQNTATLHCIPASYGCLWIEIL